jgi:hypothetical protein
MRNAFVGIDVACSKKKRLPVNISFLESERLIPLPLRTLNTVLPPKSEGNVRTLDEDWLERFSTETACYLHKLEHYFHVCVKRIAIDAPSAPKSDGKDRRQAELALDARGISCFTTPSREEFVRIKKKVSDHLDRGGAEMSMPHANQLWMLLGFALFQHLRRDWEVIEVFPQATVTVLGVSASHKSNPYGLQSQLAAAASFTGWPDPINLLELRKTCYGKLDDCLDAYLAAWVASLDETYREPFGVLPDDVIWVPRIKRGSSTLV